jgi:glucose-1-phosphate cytidylyltransferase
LNPKVVDYIENDDTVWEREPMENLVRDNQMNAFLHHGFFQPMDTLRDKLYLEELIEKGTAPWKIW